jgi:ATP-dependent phosphofructokinase / diphosphate-dependent phosphofructokinase
MSGKQIGILTGGGDCPGLNAVIRAVVRRAVVNFGWSVLGIKEGWRGLLDDHLTDPLNLSSVSGILHRGGTILKTSRTNPAAVEGGMERVAKRLSQLQLHGLVAVGGDDTLGVAASLAKNGLPVVGVPKTIDNDLSGTDYTFGYDTAVNTAMDAIDRVHTTAESHNRVMVVEVMGRHSGWIAVGAGMAAGADFILIPEFPMPIKDICASIHKRHARGKDFSIVVVAEGARVEFEQAPTEDGLILQTSERDAFGHIRLGGIGKVLAEEIERITGFETRFVILGHIQRGGSPTAFDRVLGTRLGAYAVDMIARGDFGCMAALQGNQIVSVPLDESTSRTKKVDRALYDIAATFFD